MKIKSVREWGFKELLLILLFTIVILSNMSDLLEDGIHREDAWLKILTIVLSFWGIMMLSSIIMKQSKEMTSLRSL